MSRKNWTSLTVSVMVLTALVGSVTAQGPTPPEGAPPVSIELPTSPQARIGTGFTYQGQLKNTSGPVTAVCNMAFRLYDAVTVGNPVNSPITTTVPVTSGLFTVQLDFGLYAFTGDPRYLDVRVQCPGDAVFATLTPRQAITAAPYAQGLRPGTLVYDADVLGPSFTVQNGWPGGIWLLDKKAIQAWTSDGVALWGAAGQGIAVYGVHAPITGTTAAVEGETNSTSSSANAILGRVTSTSPGGSSAAVRGINNGTGGSGIGVYGSQNGSGWGVYGYAPSGRGVYGNTSTGVGVYAGSSGSGISAPALYAYNSDTTATEPAGIAIYARNSSGDATIVAQNTSANGDSFRALSSAGGIHFRVTSTGRIIGRAIQITGGGDLAEKFEVKGNDKPEPGTLMVIDENNPGHLKVSSQAYDTKVAGIVSGAGGVNPGMTLQQDEVLDGDVVVAIAGRVYVKADARYSAIRPGDLLTTSDTPGYAMKASERDRAYGAVIGKAMTALDAGTGLVLVLVSLQ